MESARVFPKFRWVVAFASAWAWFSFGVIVLTYSPILPVLSKEFGQQIGTLVIGLMAVNSVAMAIGTMLSGQLVDRFGPRKVLLASSILVLAYCLLIPVFSHTFTQLVVLRVYQGLVIGPLFATMASLTQRWFPRNEQGTVIGISKGVFAVGSGLLFLAVPMLLQRFHGNWRLVASLGGVLLAIQVILMTIILFGKEPEVTRPAAAVATPSSNDFKTALSSPVFWVGAVLLAVAQGLMQSVNGVAPSYLMAPSPVGMGLKPFVSGHIMTFTQLGMITSGALIGFMLRYIFRGSTKWLAATSFLAAGLVIGSLGQSFTHANLGMLFFLTGALMNIGFPAVSVFITGNYPPQILGKVFAISSGISVLGGALFSGACGAILNSSHSYSAVFAFLLMIGALGFLLGAFLLNPLKAYKPSAAVAAEISANRSAPSVLGVR